MLADSLPGTVPHSGLGCRRLRGGRGPVPPTFGKVETLFFYGTVRRSELSVVV